MPAGVRIPPPALAFFIARRLFCCKRDMEKLLETLARRFRVPKRVLKDEYMRGVNLADETLPWFERTVEKVRDYHRRGYEVLTLGRDMLPLNLLLVLEGIPVKNLGISSGTKELARYTYELSGIKNVDERLLRLAYETFKRSAGYKRLRKVLEKMIRGKKVLVVDTGYRGTHAWLVAELLREMGKEAHPLLIVGRREFPGEKVHVLENLAEKWGTTPENVIGRIVDALESGAIKPLLPYRELNRSPRVDEEDDIERAIMARRIAAWLGFVRRVRERRLSSH